MAFRLSDTNLILLLKSTSLFKLKFPDAESPFERNTVVGKFLKLFGETYTVVMAQDEK